MDANLRTGGHILIEQLALHGADTVFGVPGESYLAALDGMYQSQRVRFINARPRVPSGSPSSATHCGASASADALM